MFTTSGWYWRNSNWEKAPLPDRPPEERNLVTYLIMSLKENKLLQILEPWVVREGTLEQLQTIGELVKRCLCMKSEDRPTMKELVMELESLRKFTKHPWVHQQGHEESVAFDECRSIRSLHRANKC